MSEATKTNMIVSSVSEASTVQNHDETLSPTRVEVDNVTLRSHKSKVKLKTPKEIVKTICSNRLGVASSEVLSKRAPLHGGSLRDVVQYAQQTKKVIPSAETRSECSVELEGSKDSTAVNDSTRKTSLDSRFSLLTLDSLKRRNSRRRPWTRSSPEAMVTIEEAGPSRHVQPTVLTVEKAAAAKIYLETYFHEKLNCPNQRNMRTQLLESQLYFSPHLDNAQKNAVRRSYHAQETYHLREMRALRAQSQAAGGGRPGGPYVENYEPVKVLGKGSFGVVRLVRKKEGLSKQVYAMKVIRKSDMLRSSQEGHLRAERDFLVSSEGSQ